jgi:flagella basal body P-ring formation protein FlgA
MKKMMRYPLGLLGFGLTLALAQAQGAPNLHDLNEVAATARAVVSETAPSATIDIAPLDPRIRLPRCDSPLTASLPAAQTITGSRITVRVQCNGPTPWNLAVYAEVSVEMPVVVSTRALRGGQPIAATDLEIVTRRVAGIGQCCATEPDEVIGHTVRRPIGSGEPIRLEALEMPPAIRRGELVTIIASNPGMEIRATGVALADARSGEPVRIRHSSSLRIVQARADTPGVARVDR